MPIGIYKRTKKHIAILIEIQNRPEVKLAKSVAKIEEWKNPEIRANYVVALSIGQIRRYKDPKEHKKLSVSHMADKHWNWQGGLSKLPYPFVFDKKLKELIRKRDGCICQLCSKTQKENGERLSVHHIDYVKENLDPKNLIALCRSCNSKVNVNREYWMKFFQEKFKGLK